MPEEVVLLTSDCEGFAGKQHVLSLPLLPGNVENEGENSRRNTVVLQTMRFHPWDVASLNSWEWMVFLTFQKHENCFFNSAEVWSYLNYWKPPQKDIDSTLMIKCWFWGALQVQCRNSQLTVGWHSPRALHVLIFQVSLVSWFSVLFIWEGW